MHMFLAFENPLDEVVAHDIFHIGPIGINNQMIMALVAGLLMLWIFPRLFPKADSSAPKGARNFFESILEFLRIEVFRPALKENTDKFVPFLWTLFFFILFCNLLGCIPIATIIAVLTGGHIQHLGGAATGSITTTAVLAIIAFFFIHFHGIDTIARDLMNGTYGQHGHHDEHTSNGGHGHEAAHDLEHMRGEALTADIPADTRALTDPVGHYHDGEYSFSPHEQAATEYYHKHLTKLTPGRAILAAVPLYLWNFAPHPFKPEPGESKIKWLADIPMFSFLLFLELIGALIKPFALCMRLFANMFAGHIVLAVLIGMIIAMPGILSQVAVGIPVGAMDLGIQCLEIFVAFLHAYIFTFLTTLFLASAIAPEH